MNKCNRGKAYVLSNIIRDKGMDSPEFIVFMKAHPIAGAKLLRRAVGKKKNA
jgi:hypothetical protein